MILDSSAILAIFFRESGAEVILAAIVEADFAGIGSPTATETGLVLTARLKQNATGSLLRFFEETGVKSCRLPSFIGSGRSTHTRGSARVAILPR